MWHYTHNARTNLFFSGIHSHSDSSGNYILSIWRLTTIDFNYWFDTFFPTPPWFRVALPIVTSLKFASSTLPLSNGCVSTRGLRLFFCILAILAFSSSSYFYFKRLVLA